MFENIGLSKDPWDTPCNNFVLLLKHSFIWALCYLLVIKQFIDLKRLLLKPWTFTKSSLLFNTSNTLVNPFRSIP